MSDDESGRDDRRQSDSDAGSSSDDHRGSDGPAERRTTTQPASEGAVGGEPASTGAVESGGVDARTQATGARTDEAEHLRAEIERLRSEMAELESDVEARTVHREAIERDLKRYVRRRVRRGHARGWGPYVVLLYGTAMTLGAFYFLTSGWAILAMFLIWTSTLGVYLLMVLLGATVSLLGIPGRLRNAVSEFRS